MTKKIISVGFEFPSELVENIELESIRSLSDADIVVFKPKINFYSSERHHGKILLSEDDSFKITEESIHWRSEINAALSAGKTIILFLSKFEEIYIHTGEKSYSESGKNPTTTNYVRLFNTYSFLPLDSIKFINAKGTEIRIANDLKYLSTYWQEFACYSPYNVYLEGDIPNIILTTKTNNRILGAILTNEQNGTIILLPSIELDYDEFIEEDEEGFEIWNDKAKALGQRLLSIIVEIDKSIKNVYSATPKPDWEKQEIYQLNRELVILKEINSTTKKVEELQDNLRKLNEELKNEGKLRWLLYENGHLLEEAIILALKILGISAKGYKDSDSEFDLIFLSEEGRFLGEAEGKDNSAININKLSQLERNLQEDFSKDYVEEYAHGVLFGNAYRLLSPDVRPDFFTKKCISGAKRSQVALVRTTDLFMIAKYLKENSDPDFSRLCRNELLNTKGDIVQFPMIPEKK